MHCDFLDLDDPRWLDTLRELRHDVYHLPEYVALDARRTDAQGEMVMVRDGDRLFAVPYLVRPCPSFDEEPRRFDLISPYGYPGILLNEAGRDAEFVAAALDRFRGDLRGRNVCSAFLRMHPILGEDFPDLFPAGMLEFMGETVVIDLSLDDYPLWKQIRQSHREMIRRRQKQGFVARFLPLADVLDEFLVIYQQTMDRVEAKAMYYFDRDYFVALSRMESVHCCVVESEGRIMAACIFFEIDGIIQYHLGGTLDEFMSKSPFLMTIYQGALWAKSRGNRWLHLGGGVGGGNDKLLQFKAGFSPLRRRFHVARLVIDEPLYGRLLEQRARELDTTREALLATRFFPAYRAEI